MFSNGEENQKKHSKPKNINPNYFSLVYVWANNQLYN